MKRLILLLTIIATIASACGPYFPPSYLSDLDSCFIGNINASKELLLIAEEYDLLDDHRFKIYEGPTKTIDFMHFKKTAQATGDTHLVKPYIDYATAIRNGNASAIPPDLPSMFSEFVLYLQGVEEMKLDPAVTTPKAWVQLLKLKEPRRRCRTTWVHYMLGNLATNQGDPETASIHYKACRTAARNGFNDDLGLAHASFKREYLAQTNITRRIHCGIQATAYYEKSRDQKRKMHCLEHLKIDLEKAPAIQDSTVADPIQLEALALFQIRNPKFIQRLEKGPPLKITPRLAWFMYKSGKIEKATAYLAQCPDDDILTNWLRFRIAQRNGDTLTAIDRLRLWLKQIQNSDRVIFGFKYSYNTPPTADIHGVLGSLLVTQGDMQEALIAFVHAGSYADAALIAERYLETDVLRKYVDSFNIHPEQTHKQRYYYKRDDFEDPQKVVQRSLAYLLARRLFREERINDALPYYPGDIANIVKTYQTAYAQANNSRLSQDERSAHLFLAARLMRWKGMEMRGTAHAPDYTIVSGSYDWGGVNEQEISAPDRLAALYKLTAPEPNKRFHYRDHAAELVDKAIELTDNRHQRATLLWCAGEWLQRRDPKTADVYYKQLATIRQQPLAEAADIKRWFPKASPKIEKIYSSEQYIPPEILSAAAREYTNH